MHALHQIFELIMCLYAKIQVDCQSKINLFIYEKKSVERPFLGEQNQYRMKNMFDPYLDTPGS